MAAWRAHESELRGFLIRRTGDPRVAEDLLQDVFVKVLAEGPAFCELEDPRAWLFRVARNHFTDYLRKQKRLVEIPDDLASEKDEMAAVETLTACLPRALAELPAEDTEALTLCDLKGMTQAEYARRKGITLAGAKSRVQRARRRLREHLRQACQVRFDEAGRVCCFVRREPTD
nr:sigma-70 family RNA polymerase sigma factor [Gammaproteobacteria bacterium]